MIIWWILFGLFILAMITLDLGLINRQAHVIRMKEAFLWTSFWISLAVIFGIGVYLVEGTTKSLEFFTAYLIEYSLSIDNIFVFLLIFKYFSLPENLSIRHCSGALSWRLSPAFSLF